MITMDGDMKDSEFEHMLKDVKLKEPSQKELEGFLPAVRAKIDQGYGNQAFGFRQIGLVLVVGLALAGLVYFTVAHFQARSVRRIEVPGAPASEGVPSTVAREESLSLEEELAILEAFEGEFGEATADLFGDSEILEELAALDELEFSLVLMPGQA